MKLRKFLRGAIVIVFSVCTVTLADDCFDTVVDENGKLFYIDPFNKYSVFEDKKSLTSIYGDKIQCGEEKKVYSTEEYLDEIYRDLYKEKQEQQKDSSGGNALIELVLTILGCVALWKIFVKAGKPGINSIIPIYNLYEMADIAGLSGLSSKGIGCGILGLCMIFIGLFIFPIAYFPQIGFILVCIFGIFMCIVNYNIAKNFGWTTIASILYVIFNPIAILILAFGNDKYYIAGQKEEIKEIAKKVQIDEIMGKEQIGNNNINNVTAEKVDEEFSEDNVVGQTNSTETEEDPIKYIDPNNFA